LAPEVICPVHQEGPPPAPPEEPFSPPRIAGFEIGALLGGGGFARVFDAVRQDGGGRVAIKVAREATHERFAREARALKQLGRPLVPELLGEGQTTEARPYLVLELLSGPSLGEWMDRLPGSGIAPLDDSIQRFVGICRAVGQLHQGAIVHRDLKPENVFLEGRRVRLIDFGLARFRNESATRDGTAGDSTELTRTGQRLGTAHYMAPEQCLDSRGVDFQTDIYSLGVILFELLTARPPFVGDQAQVVQAQVARRPPAPSSLARVSADLDRIVLKCLAKDPLERFARAEELIEALGGARLEPSTDLRSAGAPLPAGSRSEPVALLGVRSAAPADRLVAMVAREGGRLARIQSGRYLFSFEGVGSREASVRASSRAARALKDALPASDLLVVHLAKLQVRGGARTRLIGEDLEHPGRWWPESTRSGIVISSAAVPFSASAAVEPAGLEQRTRLRTRLYGRDELLSALKADAERAWSEPLPTVTTVVGEPGLGKSALLERVGSELIANPDVEILKLRIHADTTESDAGLRDLLRQCFELSGAVTEAEVHQRCAERLSAETAATAVPALCLALGVFTENDPRAQGVLSVPGSARSAVAKAAAEALRLRAAKRPLAILVDDAHGADPTILDGLEIATLSEERARIWVCATALPSLWTVRPFWAERSGAQVRRPLSALNPGSTRELLLELLHPVEFVPEAVLQRLEGIAQGVPLSLTELVHGLRANGAIRVSESGAWYVAADELLHESATPVYQRLAQRALETMAPPLRFIAFVCAVLGEEVSREAVEAVQAFDRASDASVDAGIGLERLVRAGLLRAEGSGNYRFRHPQLRDAVRALVPSEIRRNLHRAALKWETRLPEVARHAEAVGDLERAFNARFELAEDARRRHRYVEADQHYSAASAQLQESDAARRIAVLSGRGRVRYRLQRFSEALDDLRSARHKAEGLGRKGEVADLLLEEATVLDWLEDWQGSASLVELALPLVRERRDSKLQLRCDLALARAQSRREEYAQAAEMLPRAIEQAKALGDHEVQAIAMTLLGFALAHLDLAKSEACFEELIALCKSTGDDLHLGGAYGNRVMLWVRKRSMQHAIDDLRLAVGQARLLGNAQIERFASFNLAEFLYWQRRLEEALPYAQRAYDLGQRFFSEVPSPLDALLLARISAVLRDFEGARAQLDWISKNCSQESLAANTRVLRRLVERLCASHDHGAVDDREWQEWQRLVTDARRSCNEDELAEVLSSALEVATRSRRQEVSDWANELNRLRARPV